MGRFSAQCEYAVWGTAGPALDLPDVGCLPGFYLIQPAPMGQRVHLTQKPDDLMRAIARICRPDGVVLDPFTGSGSTGVGALLEGRRFVGVERVKAHIEASAKRLEQAESNGIQVSILDRPVEGQQTGLWSTP